MGLFLLILGLALGADRRVEVAGAARFGPPAREFASPFVGPDRGTWPIGGEVAVAWHRARVRLGVRGSLALEGWTRRWRERLEPQDVWGREVGFRLEPRLSARLILAPRWMWSYRFSVVPTVDVGVGAGLVLFADGDRGWWALSPTLGMRPALHLGRERPVFVALDVRIGVHGQLDDCYPGRPWCPEAQLNPGGTSLGVLVGGAF